MFNDQNLLDYVSANTTLEIESLVIAEWNLNDLETIENYGNYRYRSTSAASSQFYNILDSYDSADQGNYYSDALESRTVSEYAVDNNDASLLFTTKEVDRELYFSLKECFQPFRPRSGINKCLWFSNKYIDNVRSARRPRYYMASRYDKFKYWNSYRKENGVERGVSSFIDTNNIGYAIDDVAPFVVYSDSFAANRIVVKMQTNLSETALDDIRTQDGDLIVDPISDRELSSIPRRWKIQYLDTKDNWIDAVSFDEDSTRRDGGDIVPWDGYVELSYGIVVPDEYREAFKFISYLSSSAQLPIALINGQAHIVGATTTNAGQLYIWNQVSDEWETYDVQYGFSLLEDNDTKKRGIVSRLVDPDYYINNSETIYREVVYLKGLRVVVETMYGPNSTFDLIEMSPRLKADITNYVVSFETNKLLANSNTTIPVGGLVPSSGQLTLMNHDGAFNENNTTSLVYGLLKPNIRFDFYETVINVDGFDKFIPIKSFYNENFPIVAGGIDDFNLELRDLFFRLETSIAPSIMLNNTTLTKAVAVLLDHIGFSNYVFKSIDAANDPVIPYFFVEPDISVAEVLQRLAIATQTAMFFDEYNNFVVMSKEYLLPETYEREADYILSASPVITAGGTILANIERIESIESNVINNGQINYITRYIQRSPAKLSQATKTDEERTYIYKPVLLWEVGNQTETKTINEANKSSGYSLGAVALNTTLNASAPYVEDSEIKNNIIDVGENIYWLPRFQGYLYANGEIIRYDAVEYTIPGQGTFWITNNQEYQKYFSNLPFNGKIYPTGNIRIYVEPYYEELESADVIGLEPGVIYKDGVVKSHGRGQFGTDIVEHNSGLSPYWSDNENVRGMEMQSKYLFTTTPTESIVLPEKDELGVAVGVDNTTAQASSRNGILANFMRQSIPDDDFVKTLKTTAAGTIQSSALIFTGPNPIPAGIEKRDFISYIYKEMSEDFKHFGTRMRIIGKPESNEKILTAQNASDYYTVEPQSANETSTISGGSGGIGALVNPEKNYGYFFEIVSLTGDNLQQYTTADPNTNETTSVLHNLIFYKVVPSSKNDSGATVETYAQPRKLWGGLSQILVDEGKFVGQDRLANQSKPTVYDLAIEYENIGTTRRFYLYVNSILVATVDDVDPLPMYNNMAIFTRGSSKCMFENVYALKNLQSRESSATVVNSVSNVFTNTSDITSSDTIKKYAISGLVQSTYLSGISANSGPKYSIYYEEFGTILRECAYFNIKYDQAYPAVLAFIAPTFNNEKTYTVSGFRAGSYGAEFLIFNNTDKAIVLDETSGSYLRIIGVTFTQNISNVLTVDDYFKELSNFSDPVIIDNTIRSPQRADKLYQNIRLSRSKYGEKTFSLNSPYIQNQDLARDLMDWIMKKTIRPRKHIYVETFGTMHLQLGDVVKINYTLPEGNKFVDENKHFVVSEVFYSRSPNDVKNRLRLVEV